MVTVASQQTGGLACLVVVLSTAASQQTGGLACLVVILSIVASQQTGGLTCLVVILSTVASQQTGGSLPGSRTVYSSQPTDWWTNLPGSHISPLLGTHFLPAGEIGSCTL